MLNSCRHMTLMLQLNEQDALSIPTGQLSVCLSDWSTVCLCACLSVCRSVLSENCLNTCVCVMLLFRRHHRRVAVLSRRAASWGTA